MKPTLADAEWFKGLVEKHPEIGKLEITNWIYYVTESGSIMDELILMTQMKGIPLPDSDWMRQRIRGKGWLTIESDVLGMGSFHVIIKDKPNNISEGFLADTEWQAHVLAWLFFEGIQI